MWIRVLFVSLSVVVCSSVEAQKSRRVEPKGKFSFVARGGICASQIHGDGFGGYNKMNLSAGIGTHTSIGHNLKFHMEIGYCGRGSRKRPNDPAKTDLTRIAIHYIDVPVLLRFWISRFEFEAGLCNAVAVASREERNYFKAPDGFRVYYPNRYELAALAGIYVPINAKWSVNGRFHYSVLPAFGRYRHLGGGMIVGGDFNNAITLALCRVFTSG